MRRTAIVLAATWLSIPAGAEAQTPPRETPRSSVRLTLAEAIERARLNNPGHQQAVHSLELNEIENREFWLGFLPQPQVTFLSTNMQWNQQPVGQDNFGNPIPNPEIRMVQSASSRQSASLNFQLDFRDLVRRRMSHLQAEGREVGVDQSAEALSAEVRLAFLDAQETLEFRALEETLLTVRKVNHEITESLFRLAQRDRADLLGAELDFVDQELQLEQSRSALRATLLRLRNLIGDPALGEIEIEPAPLRVFDPSVLDEESIVADALVSSPRIRQGQLGIRQAEGQAALQRAEWLPTLNLSAGTARDELSRGSGSGFFQPIPDGEWGRRVSVSVQFPDLGAYFNRQTTARRTGLDIRNAGESLREARFQVEEEVRVVLAELANQYRTLEIQERRAELAAEQLELQQELYRLGRVDYLALQNSAATAAGAQRQALQARYAFERALIRLERAVGAPVELPPAQED